MRRTLITLLPAVFATGLFGLLVGCVDESSMPTSSGSNPEHVARIAFDTLAVIDGADQAGSSGLMGSPAFVRVDSLGCVYVADRATMRIKVYDSTGTWLTDIGERGAGPREFQHLTAVHVEPSGGVHVADEYAQRYTALSANGTVVDESTFKGEVLAWPRWLLTRDGGTLVMSFRMPTDRGERPDSNNFLLHEFDRDLNRVAVGVPFDDYWPPDVVRAPVGNVFAQFSPGVFTLMRVETVLYAPALYDGTWYAFERNENGSFVLSKTMTSGTGITGTFESISEETAEREARRLNTWNASYAGVKYPIRVQRQAVGVFELSNGDIVLFDQASTDDSISIRVELFDPAGDSRLLQTLASVPIDGTGGYLPRVAWVDSADRLYVIDYSPTPRITVLQIRLLAA